MKTASETLKTIGDFVEKVLELAEEKGLTVNEMFTVPEALKNKLLYELENREVLYKREKPQV